MRPTHLYKGFRVVFLSAWGGEGYLNTGTAGRLMKVKRADVVGGEGGVAEIGGGGCGVGGGGEGNGNFFLGGWRGGFR